MLTQLHIAIDVPSKYMKMGDGGFSHDTGSFAEVHSCLNVLDQIVYAAQKPCFGGLFEFLSHALVERRGREVLLGKIKTV